MVGRSTQTIKDEPIAESQGMKCARQLYFAVTYWNWDKQAWHWGIWSWAVPSCFHDVGSLPPDYKSMGIMPQSSSWSSSLAPLMELEVWLAMNNNNTLAGGLNRAQQRFKLFIAFYFLKTCTEWKCLLDVKISQLLSDNTILT